MCLWLMSARGSCGPAWLAVGQWWHVTSSEGSTCEPEVPSLLLGTRPYTGVMGTDGVDFPAHSPNLNPIKHCGPSRCGCCKVTPQGSRSWLMLSQAWEISLIRTTDWCSVLVHRDHKHNRDNCLKETERKDSSSMPRHMIVCLLLP